MMKAIPAIELEFRDCFVPDGKELATKLKAWFREFDVFGGITSGEYIVEDGAFHFEYSYEINGEMKKMRDFWLPMDENTCQYQVVMQEEGEWSKVLLSAEMQRITEEE